MRRFNLMVLGLLIGASGSTEAGFITRGITGLPNAATTINFTEIALPNFTQVTNQYSSLGVTFNGLYYSTAGSGPGISGPALVNFADIGSAGPENINNPFLVRFNAVQTQAALTLVTDVAQPGGSPATALIELLLISQGMPVQTVASQTFSPSDARDVRTTYTFTGFDGGFNAIRITNNSGAGPNTAGAATIDNLQFGIAVVPEPASLIGLSAGLCLVSGFRWRMRRSKVAT